MKNPSAAKQQAAPAGSISRSPEVAFAASALGATLCAVLAGGSRAVHFQ